MNLFRTLSPKEVEEFRQSARENYELFSPISSVWHPVYCEECTKMNLEAHDAGNTKQL